MADDDMEMSAMDDVEAGNSDFSVHGIAERRETNADGNDDENNNTSAPNDDHDHGGAGPDSDFRPTAASTSGFFRSTKHAGHTKSDLVAHFIQAAREGNVEQCQWALAQANRRKILNATDEEQLTALHYAARHNHKEVIDYLFRSAGKQGGGQHTEKTDWVAQGEEGETALHLAAKYNNTEAMTVLLLYKPDNTSIMSTDDDLINIRDEYGQTPLHYAVVRGCLEAAKLLLDAGADANVADNEGVTPLHHAANYGWTEIQKVLVEHRASLFACDSEGGQPVHYAAREGRLEITKALLEYASPDTARLVRSTDLQRDTPLHLAVDNGHLQVAAFLLDSGADANDANDSEMTPLHMAARNGMLDLASLLIERGANINAREINNMTALHLAAKFDHADVADRLITAGSHLDAKDNEGMTPFLSAVATGQLKVLELILKRGADVEDVDRAGNTAMILAVRERHTEIVALLIDKITNETKRKNLLRSVDKYDNTAMHHAAEGGELQIIEILLKTGEAEALLTAKNDSERTPLHVACVNGRKKTVERLVSFQPTLLEDSDEWGQYAVHHAAHHGHASCLEVLLDAAAAVDARDDALWTPLDHAAAQGHLDAARVLLEAGAPVDSVDKNNMTPMHHACENGYPQVVALLLEHRANLSLRTTVAGDNGGLTPFELAIMNNQLEVCKHILNSPSWEKALQPPPGSASTGPTPMKMMIEHLPEAAYVALSRCQKVSDLPRDDPNYFIKFKFKYIDDKPNDKLDHEFHDDPLMLMVRRNRSSLLSHPVTAALINYKWDRFGLSGYMANLLAYLIFLAFLTAFVARNDVQVADGAELGTFSNWGAGIVIGFSVLRIIAEILQMLHEGRDYFVSVQNLLEWALFATSLGFMVPIDAEKNQSQWTSGAFAVFLGWLNLALFTRQLPQVGIYVIMFRDVARTVVKAMLVFLMLIAGFAFAFHILLHDRYQFSSAGRSLMKTFVMMTGEFEYATYFQLDLLEFPGLSYAMFVLFVILMPIILMNLLIGLAVDDINNIMENARLEKLKMSVQYVLPLQEFLAWLKLNIQSKLPDFVNAILPISPPDELFYVAEYKLMVNQRTWFQRLLYRFIGDPNATLTSAVQAEDFKKPIEVLQEENEGLRSELAQMRGRLEQLRALFQNQSSILRTIAEHRKLNIKDLDLDNFS